MLRTAPAVFAVDDKYHIMVPVTGSSVLWVKIGDNEYYDESNGILRSEVSIHRVIVPMEELDKAEEYTIFERPIIERKPYFPTTMPVVEKTIKFRPVKPNEEIRAYHLSDTHNRTVGPIAAARVFGDIDLLILNGDIPDHSGSAENMMTVYMIVSELTRGQIPTVFSRGNHDMRGLCAEKFAEYTPNSKGNTYYTFRLGSLWGLVLDCAEDKPDSHEEYGHMICCHTFRRRQTEFIKSVIANAQNEYEQDGIENKVVIVHNPFTLKKQPPFDIEEDTYNEWGKLIKENIRPDLMICGHTHTIGVHEQGSEYDNFSQPCTLIVASAINGEYYIGCGITFSRDEITATYTDSNGEVISRHKIK
ncbi:MAG: metallophosphoesterase [Clostridia bacterium]|nr:metallophosphoesterase [Clostridia bacterium]